MKRSKVFVVDDDPVFTNIIEHNFKAQNVNNVLVLASGEECIKQLGSKPRLILLDFSLGGLNGLDVLGKIKEKSPKTEVIILTALEDDTVRTKCLQAGAADYINKDESGLAKIRDEVIPNYKSSGLFSLFK
jgi:DNA-binding response OmpR family regulator